MKGNFDRALARVLVYEGGYSNNPKDPGGATDKGVTQGTYNSWRLRQGLATAPVKGIKDAEVAMIYKLDFWDRIKGDELASGVDFCMFDAAVNSGVGGATKWAQAVLGLNPDGDMGPKTLEAIQGDDPEDFVRAFCAHRLGTLQRLKTWSTFGKGWHARVANVQATSLAWAEAADSPEATLVADHGGNAKARPADVPVSKTSVIATHVGTLGGVVATGAAQVTQTLTGVGDTFSWVKYALGGLTVVGAVAGLLVYLSKAANDAAANATRTATVDPDAGVGMASVPVADPPPTTVVTQAQTTTVGPDTVTTVKATEVKTNG